MITKIEAKDRYCAEHGWLTSYHLFSFAEYYDPRNMNFGVLRVFNDDKIDGENGFGAHGHQNMEIVTIVLKGELTHEDTMGNRKSIKAGEVQYMSAGTGVKHSEMNLSHDAVHLYQIWLTPRKNNLIPKYDQKDFSDMEKNILVPVVSGYEDNKAIHIESEATIYKGNFEEGKDTVYEVSMGMGVFIYVTEGILEINGIIFSKGDQARIIDEKRVVIMAKEYVSFALISVAL